MIKAYDPLDYDNLAGSVVTALLQAESFTLPPTRSFVGSGVYALYYQGKLPFYSHVAAANPQQPPIYVGKAVPTGARKGSHSPETGSGKELYNRLSEHAKSVNQAENLQIAEFHVRYLVVVPVWITLAERFLISRFQPLWNTVIDGFGNHPPGQGRRNTKRSKWDIVHPGRAWARELQAAETAEQVIQLIPCSRSVE